MLGSRANAASLLPVHARMIKDFVKDHGMNRELEALPSEKEIRRRTEADRDVHEGRAQQAGPGEQRQRDAHAVDGRDDHVRAVHLSQAGQRGSEITTRAPEPPQPAVDRPPVS